VPRQRSWAQGAQRGCAPVREKLSEREGSDSLVGTPDGFGPVVGLSGAAELEVAQKDIPAAGHGARLHPRLRRRWRPHGWM
jgi:hypothetical protein